MSNNPARTRFAPSPTGFLHVGGVRTALFAWLIARQTGGQFILRLEDTDKAREVEGSGRHIMDSLRWLGIDWDEGIEKGGDSGPYKQSERLDIYKEWAQKLVDSGRAYADPYTPDEVEAFRRDAIAQKQPFLYRNHRPENPPTYDGSKPLRFRSDPKEYTWNDAVMGELHTGPEVIDDFIIIKSDGYPTYNFAHIIDDYLMQCTHVTRSQEFLASTPKYLNLYEALGITPPILATLPFVLGETGNKKLSKRDGAKDILDYAAQGFLPESLVNFMASLGWNDGSEQEVYTVEELIEKFSLEKVHKNGARFDERRLLWLNGAHIRNLSLDALAEKVATYWPEAANDYDEPYRLAVLALVQERLKFFKEIPELSSFFFSEPVIENVIGLIQDDKNKQLKKLDTSEKRTLLEHAKRVLEATEFTRESIQNTLNELLTELDTKPAVLFGLIRIATTGAPASPELFGSLMVIGKEKSLQRLELAIRHLA